MKKVYSKKIAGFTALELLMVIAVISILAGLLLTGVTAAGKKARKGATKSLIESLTVAARAYRNDYYVFPPETYGGGNTSANLHRYLCAKFVAGKNSTINSGPYCEIRTRNRGSDVGDADMDGVSGNEDVYSIIDSWGNVIVYDSTNPPNNINSIDIYSYGPDGVDDSGDNDDITNWD